MIPHFLLSNTDVKTGKGGDLEPGAFASCQNSRRFGQTENLEKKKKSYLNMLQKVWENLAAQTTAD